MGFEGLMMRTPLTLRLALERAARLFPEKDVVTRTESGVVRRTYGEVAERAARLAGALRAVGIRDGDRVATFAVNSTQHLECYLAVPCMGAVLHTLNIRLHPEQVAWIANHAEDRVVFVDEALLPVFESVLPRLRTVEQVVVIEEREAAGRTLTGRTALPTLGYEEFVASAPGPLPWPDLDEDAACAMCYTSGTTGDPKGVVYSHRSMVLHALMSGMADTNAISERDRVMPVVPMFHANAWGLPWAATLVGASQVFPSRFTGPGELVALMREERVSVAAGVPTIWIGVLDVLEREDVALPDLERIIGGGAAVPRSLIEAFERRGIPLLHGWGMTETGPLAGVSRIKSSLAERPADELLRLRATQGLIVPGMEFRVVAENGREVPWDGESMGEVHLRGNWVARTYYRDDRAEGAWAPDGWLRTGDVGVVHPDGYLQLVDRTKDLVKSGGEWISSVDLENTIMGHPAVLEAAVIAIPDPKWGERPLACILPRAGETPTATEIRDWLADRVPKWWLPDRIEIVDEVPKTSVGKFDKKLLRARFTEP